MEHEASHSNPGFGQNTNGLGIVIVALSLVVIALLTFSFWHKGTAENNWYRFEQTAPAAGHGEGHEAAGGHEAPKAEAAAPAVADSAAHTGHDSTAAAKPAADSAAAH